MLAPFPGNFMKDAYGNAGIDQGGTEGVMYFPFDHTMTADQVAFELPAGAIITDMGLAVKTTFDNAPTLSVGDSASDVAYLNAASVLGTAGPVYSTAWITTNWFTLLSSPETIIVKVGGTPSQGAGVLRVRYRLG